MKKIMNKLFKLRLKICKYFIKAKAIERREEKNDLFELQTKTILKFLIDDKTERESVKLFEAVFTQYLTKKQTKLDQIISDKKILEKLIETFKTQSNGNQ